MSKQLKKDNTPKKRSFISRILRILVKTFIVLILLFLVLLLFLRSPWGQNIIVQKAADYLAEKTKTTVAIKKLFIDFSGDINLEGLYVEDQKGDTLVYSQKLSASVPVLPILQKKSIAINQLEWNGLTANISRKDSLTGFNFDFITEAFADNSQAHTTTKNTTDKNQSEPFQISVGEINFKNINLQYRDGKTGINARLNLDQFRLKAQKTDLDKMRFRVALLSLKNTNIDYTELKAIESPEDTTQTQLPYIFIEKLVLENVTTNYHSIPQKLWASANLAEFSLLEAEVDLSNNNLSLQELLLNNSEVSVQMKTMPAKNPTENKTASSESFPWPNWNIKAASISMNKNDICLQQNGEIPQPETFNPQAIDVNNFTFQLSDVALSKDTKASLNLEELSFYEAGGFQLNNFSFRTKIDERQILLNDFSIATKKSKLNGNFSATFNTLEEFINNPENGKFSAVISSLTIDPTEVYRFAPELKNNPEYNKISQHPITGSVSAEGNAKNLDLKNLTLSWGKATKISGKGNLKNLTDPKNFQFQLPDLQFATTRNEILAFVSEEELGISIPENIQLESSLSGKLAQLSAKANLKTSNGNIRINGRYSDTQKIDFESAIELVDLELDKILSIPTLGTLSAKIETSGNGNNINELDAHLKTDFSKLSYNDYDLSDLQLNGKITQGKGDATLSFKDKNVDVNLQSHLKLDSIAPEFDVNLAVGGANLQSLGITQDDIRIKFNLDVLFKGNAENFDLQAQIADNVAVYENKPYYMDNVDLQAAVANDSTFLKVSSSFLKINLQSNANPGEISKAMYHHFRHYFTDSLIQKDSLQDRPVALKMDAKITTNPIISEVFLKGIEELDTLTVDVDFSEANKTLSAHAYLPHLIYNENRLDSLQFSLASDYNSAAVEFGFGNLKAGPLSVGKTYLEGNLNNDTLFVDFNAYDNDKKLYHIQSELTSKNDTLQFRVNPADLILNKKEWKIPQNNRIAWAKKHLNFTDFVLSNEDQKLTLTNDLGIKKEHFGVSLKDFRLPTLTGYFNPDSPVVSGVLQGDVVLVDPFGKRGVVADLEVKNFIAVGVLLGNLKLDAKADGNQRYRLDLSLKGEEVDIALKGGYRASESDPKLNFRLNTKKLDMLLVERFASDYIKDSKGSIAAKVGIKGTPSDPDYKGFFKFNNTQFTVKALNAPFTLSDEQIRVDNSGIKFSNFSLADEAKNTFTIDGDIVTKTFTNPDFDLTIKAKDFQALNSTKKDNGLFYGKANFDADANLTGNLNLPKLKVDLSVNEETNVTYVMSESQAEVVERDGVVVFVNRENPDDILTRTDKEKTSAILKGIDLEANVRINPKSEVNIIIDERTGDNARISGEGGLNFAIEPNGRTTLSGLYKINDGHYEMNLYNLVKRRFEIAPESTISWNGDPMDAKLDISAIYNVKTSASSLMAFETAGETASVKNRYKQVLPFMVYLNIDGELSSPELNFSLDMPKDERGAIGGSVYGRITQLNQQQDALNKQVFSLLVLNRFYPESGSDGSQGGAETIARSNLNQALSDQLNMFSDKLMGNTGVELNFGLNSYTDYQGSAPQNRTDLDISAQKKLFDDRLVVQAGSEVNVEGNSRPGEENPVIGNVSIEYLITENGRWRLKGFRKSEYENIIDGQVFVSGIGLIFTREFNKFKELWKKAAEEEKENPKNNQDKETEKTTQKN